MAHHHEHTHTDGCAQHHEHSADVHTAHCDCGCGAAHGDDFEKTKKEELTKLLLSAAFFAAGWVLSELTQLPEFLYLICFLISYLLVGFAVVREALEELLHGRLFGECFLISLASLGAFAIHEYSEGCAVMLLYAAGEYIQGAALSKSRAQIRALAAEHGFAESHANSGTERFIAKFAKIYTPVICAVALLILLVPPLFFHGEWQLWVHKGLSALVIGCPCAIVISVPLAFSCAIGACTKQGIFVHCSDALERLHKTGESDEIVIPEHTEEKLHFAGRAAKKAVTLATENIIFAVAVKLAVLVCVVLLNREIPMWLAEFSDVGVAILAILNSLRALRTK